MQKYFKFLAKRQILPIPKTKPKQQQNTRKLPYRDFLNIYRWQNYRNPNCNK